LSQLQQPLPTLPSQPFRLDVPLHDLLQQQQRNRPELSGPGKTLPEPVFPQYPELLHEIDADDIAAHERVLRTGKRQWPPSRILKTMRGWIFQGVTGSFE
jgi:hypothetical protein